MSTTFESLAAWAGDARAALEAADAADLHRKNEYFPVAAGPQSLDASAMLCERFPTPDDLRQAIAADDPSVIVFACQLLAPVDADRALDLALAAARATVNGAEGLDLRASRSAAMVLGPLGSRVPLDVLTGLIRSEAMLSIPSGILSHPELTGLEAQRWLLESLATVPSNRHTPARQLRTMLIMSLVAAEDPPTIAWLVDLAVDGEHPLSNEAVERLPKQRLASLLDDPALPARHRGAAIGAAVMTSKVAQITTELAPRLVVDPGDAEALLSFIRHGLLTGHLPKTDEQLALYLLSLVERDDVAEAAKETLSLMNQRTVKAAAKPPKPAKRAKAAKPAEPARRAAPAVQAAGRAPSRGPLYTRYVAGEYRAVWDELRSLGDDLADEALDDARAVARETVDRFGESVAAIVTVLKAAKYPFAARKPLPPARADAAKKLAALRNVVGDLPLVVEAFYSAFDGVNLGQHPGAVVPATSVLSLGALDELGRHDPLILAPLAATLADAKAIAKRNERLAPPLQKPLWPYLAPDPASKGMGDDVADEHPTRFVPQRSADARLGDGVTYLVDWLRDYVTAGGFRGWADDADRSTLTKRVVAF